MRTGGARHVAVVGAILLAGCTPVPPSAGASTWHGGREVRVGLAVRVPGLELRLVGPWEVHAGRGARQLDAGGRVHAVAGDDRVLLDFEDGGQAADGEAVVLVPRDDAARVELGGVPYRGRILLRRDAGSLTVVDVLEIEEYLRGVVPWEIGRTGPEALSAVEAQAVAARTYTLARLGQFSSQGFDLHADERDQVFKGAAREDPVVDRALRETRGLVLESHGTLVQAYYSSTCGGHTSWIENVWPKPAAPYLRGRRDAPTAGRSFCAASKHFRWTEAWAGAVLESILQETLPRALQWPAGRRPGGLVDLRIAARDASARVLDLDVVTTTGTYRVHGDGIRWMLRPGDRPLLRSLMFDLEIERDRGAIVRVTLRGGGNGHGVGMCQTGALGMARAGYDVAAILGHYYPGTSLRRAY